MDEKCIDGFWSGHTQRCRAKWQVGVDTQTPATSIIDGVAPRQHLTYYVDAIAMAVLKIKKKKYTRK